MMFQGTRSDANQAFAHYLAKFQEQMADIASVLKAPDNARVFAAQAHLEVSGVGKVLLSISAPSNIAYADANSYIAALTVTEAFSDSDGNAVQRLYRQLDLLPLTSYELADLRRQFPLTQEFAESRGSRAMADHAFYLSIHHMTDFVAMMDALLAMGADPRYMTILDKGYPYTRRDRVDGWLRDTLGIKVDPYPERVASLDAHIERARGAGLKTIIFDDGGYIWPVVVEYYLNAAAEFVGIVEQTMSGIWKLDGLPLPIPVFSVAESQLKATVESYGVATAAVASIFDRLPHEKFEGRPALVVGYGRIGREVATILRERRMRVAVHDSEIVALVAAHEEGFITSRSLAHLIESHQPLLVVGAAGRGSLRGEHLSAFRKSCYLASVTSRTYEFDLEEFAEVALKVLNYDRLGHAYHLGQGVELCVLGHGMPMNFYHAESLPNRYIDLIISALLLGGVTLAQPDSGGLVAGHNLALTNTILNTSAALDTYYDWYGEPSARRELLTPGGSVPAFHAVPWAFPPQS